jgi:hypothetical protein
MQRILNKKPLYTIITLNLANSPHEKIQNLIIKTKIHNIPPTLQTTPITTPTFTPNNNQNTNKLDNLTKNITLLNSCMFTIFENLDGCQSTTLSEEEVY